jgi:hypothetical protein
MRTIKVDGVEYPAYSLLMRKENALAILQGKKTIETRLMSKRYFKMFTDPDKLKKRKEFLANGGSEDECESVCRTDIGFIHFYSTGANWTLDVEIDELDTCELTVEGLDFLKEEFGFDEFDDVRNEIPEEYKPGAQVFFYAHIKEIVGHSGL